MASRRTTRANPQRTENYSSLDGDGLPAEKTTRPEFRAFMSEVMQKAGYSSSHQTLGDLEASLHRLSLQVQKNCLEQHNDSLNIKEQQRILSTNLKGAINHMNLSFEAILKEIQGLKEMLHSLDRRSPLRAKENVLPQSSLLGFGSDYVKHAISDNNAGVHFEHTPKAIAPRPYVFEE